ncbi:MAG TPA: VOC family protein [Streptosporangiaceae bacterium]
MVQRDTPWPAGTPCWVDLGTDDVARATSFYSTLFGWDTQVGPPETGGYVMCEVQGRPVAGIGPKMGPAEVPTAWTTYLASDDADATTSKVTAAGGSVLADPFDITDVGRMSVAADPGGAVFGIWQSRAHSGMQLANVPGAVCWNENMSRGFDANKAFYQAVFGYDYDDMSGDDFHYATFRTTGDPMGGIGDLAMAPAETPAHWMTYFGVEDADQASDVVTKLGGSVMRPAWDTPYGRMAIMTDDQGAAFAIMAMAQTGDQ